MTFDYKAEYGEKQTYIITYKSLINGSTSIVTGEFWNHSEAEKVFNRKFQHEEVIKIQSSREWMGNIGSDIATELIKHIKTLDSLAEKG